MKLLAELKRRNVLRMAGLYLVGAWLVVLTAGAAWAGEKPQTPGYAAQLEQRPRRWRGDVPGHHPLTSLACEGSFFSIVAYHHTLTVLILWLPEAWCRRLGLSVG
jgi:hypothetical protein